MSKPSVIVGLSSFLSSYKAAFSITCLYFYHRKNKSQAFFEETAKNLQVTPQINFTFSNVDDEPGSIATKFFP
uniref:Uncharacterized protein n=1 Tax=Panagrolaimus sp. JU765 TaxID=591449 RepID=A0AC34QS98_9BILA